MKTLIMLTLLTGIAFFTSAQNYSLDQTNNDAITAKLVGADMTFESETIDYGEIEFGSDGKRQFSFTNTGNEPLIISKCKKSCGCTVPTCPEEPVLPGKSATIDVSYDTKRAGDFTKTITILSNAAEQSKVIKITGTVLPEGDM